MYYLFYFLSIINKLFLPNLYKRKMVNYKKHHFLILGFKYWVTKNLLYFKNEQNFKD